MTRTIIINVATHQVTITKRGSVAKLKNTPKHGKNYTLSCMFYNIYS